MSETSRNLRAIAHNYLKAAEHLEAAEWLAAVAARVDRLAGAAGGEQPGQVGETSRTLRAIAHNYIKAAEHLEAAEWLAAVAARVDRLAGAAGGEQPGQVGEAWMGGRAVEPAGAWQAELDAMINARVEAHHRTTSLAHTPEPAHTGESAPHAAAGLKDATIADTYARCIRTLGWDPDTLSSVEVVARVGCLSSIDELDCAETLEKRRAPRKASRSTVLTAIAKRRAELEAAGVQS